MPARVVAAHRLADRITLELDVDGQARPLELDFVATPGREHAGAGQRRSGCGLCGIGCIRPDALSLAACGGLPLSHRERER